MLKLYDYKISGNCYKARLMLWLLKLKHEIIPVALEKGEHKSPKYLKLNPFGQVPVLVDGDIIVRDSQAILIYLAQQYNTDDWLPNGYLQHPTTFNWD